MTGGLPKLETFVNSKPGAEAAVRVEVSNFTSVCPVTHEGDVGKLVVEYVPGHRCLEAFSFGAFLQAFANVEMYHEEIIHEVFDSLAAALNPRRLHVRMEFPIYSRQGGYPILLVLTKGTAA